MSPRRVKSELLTVAEIAERYPDQWVLIEIVRDRKDTWKAAGRLIARSADRNGLLEPHKRFRAENPDARLFTFFTGELVADEDVVIVL